MSPSAEKPGEQDPHQVRMTFAEHLEELRRRLIRGGLVIGVIFCLGWFVFPSQLEAFFLKPHLWAVDRLANFDPPIVIERRLAVLSPLEQIFYRVKVAMLTAALIGLPYALWQLWAFVGAGLFKHERKAVMRYVPWSLGLAFAGMIFGYLVMIPILLEYLYTMPNQELFVQSYQLESYFSLFLLFTFSLAAIFQMPIIMLGLHTAGIGSAQFYSKYRRHFIVIAFIFAGVVTPPDPISQSLLAFPMLALYEIGLLGIRYNDRRKRQAAAKQAPQ